MKNLNKISVVFNDFRQLTGTHAFKVAEIRGATSIYNRSNQKIYVGDTVSEREAEEMEYSYNVIVRPAKNGGAK